jgi:hypothetical protein
MMVKKITRKDRRARVRRAHWGQPRECMRILSTSKIIPNKCEKLGEGNATRFNYGRHRKRRRIKFGSKWILSVILLIFFLLLLSLLKVKRSPSYWEF